MSSRKRAAPGADVPIQPAPSSNNYQPVPDYPFDGQTFDWARAENAAAGMNNGYNAGQTYGSTFFDPNNADQAAGFIDVAQYNAGGADQGQLVRRSMNQQLIPRGLAWQENDPSQQVAQAWDEEDEADLDERAVIAKRDAQARRKQIPPFIQKLSSFLDESNNTDLIQWSEDGRSFIVLDEEEFAKTLIPELFKHNNYASFVRQLNMYGFHKKVGLSDNSMKASENKRKTPSEYWNKYFRRGRPELLWLIQKPKTAPTTKGKPKDGRGDHSDDEKKPIPNDTGEAPMVGTQNQDLATIPKQELVAVRQELLTLQRQQKLISGVIGQIKRQNDQLYQQAAAFQEQHNRHESSINAILTFLATFYNRSLEGGQINMADMFKNAMSGQNQQTQGNIVEMPDLPHMEAGMGVGNGVSSGQVRRRPLLLPAPDPKTSSSIPAPATTAAAPSANRIMHPRTQNPAGQTRKPPAPRVSSIEDSGFINDVPSPPVKIEAQTPKSMGDAQDILSVINAANANSPAQSNNLDFSSALEQLQHSGDGNSMLTPQQQKQMLSMFTNSSPPSGPSSDGPSIPQQMSQINRSNEQLEMLQKLQQQQAAKMANLAERLGPLSPNGAIPGFHDAQVNGTPIPAPDWNLDDWINDNSNSSQFGFDPDLAPDASYADLGINLDGNNGNETSNFTLGGANNDVDGEEYFPVQRDAEHLDTGRRIESLTSRETTPGGALAGDDGDSAGGGARKRRKTADP